MTTEETQHQYNAFAPWYNVVEGLSELLGIRRLRRALLQRASGTTLEVAVGTGKSLRSNSVAAALALETSGT